MKNNGEVEPITSEKILAAYQIGIFPMAESKKSNKVFWVRPEKRGIIPIRTLHISRTTKKFIKKNIIKTTTNTCFNEVVNKCSDRTDTWINKQLHDVYFDLYEKGHAFSVEVWINSKLVGGLFGIAMGSCFCGESMFSESQNGSKLALIVTMARLVHSRFTLFDTQFTTDHLSSMGGIEISTGYYKELLASAIGNERNFCELPDNSSWSELMQLNNQTL